MLLCQAPKTDNNWPIGWEGGAVWDEGPGRSGASTLTGRPLLVIPSGV